MKTGQQLLEDALHHMEANPSYAVALIFDEQFSMFNDNTPITHEAFDLYTIALRMSKDEHPSKYDLAEKIIAKGDQWLTVA